MVWPTLQAKGWSEAHTFAEDVLGTPTEPTYKEEPRNDTTFFSPELAGSVTKISVHKGFLFPQHKPITITFKIPSIPINIRVWKIPKPLSSEQLEIIKLDAHDEFFVDVMCSQDLDTETPGNVSLEAWSSAAESALNSCLIQKEQPGLKPGQRGRGKPPVYKLLPIKKEGKLGCVGDYQPPHGGTSVISKQCARQIRRLESISRTLAKHGATIQACVQDDWRAVSQAKGFSPDFFAWAELDFLEYPTDDLVNQLLGITKARSQELAKIGRKTNQERWNNDLHHSWKNKGNQLAHKVSKKPTNPWLTTAKEEVMLEARRTGSKSKGPAIFQIAAQEVQIQLVR